jgi:hypothetical protein
MSHERKGKVEDPHFEGEIEFYGDPDIATFDAKVPKFLKLTYLIWPIWGIITFYFFWNGSVIGWMDRGYWYELQIAANTTFPIANQNMLSQDQSVEETVDRTLPPISLIIE